MKDKIRAVIFDFNGTLFNDTDFHNEAWNQFALKYGRKLEEEDYNKHIHGYTNKEIFKYLLDEQVNESNIEQLYEEKESIYRSLCQKYPEKVILTPGATEFFDVLTRNDIPRTIATASYKPNVDMYFEVFGLEKWFDPGKVVYDSGNYRGKPHPDIFLAAIKNLGIPAEECLIIEDSPAGLQAAHNAGAGKIIAVNFNNAEPDFPDFGFIDQVIQNFQEIEF